MSFGKNGNCPKDTWSKVEWLNVEWSIAILFNVKWSNVKCSNDRVATCLKLKRCQIARFKLFGQKNSIVQRLNLTNSQNWVGSLGWSNFKKRKIVFKLKQSKLISFFTKWVPSLSPFSLHIFYRMPTSHKSQKLGWNPRALSHETNTEDQEPQSHGLAVKASESGFDAPPSFHVFLSHLSRIRRLVKNESRYDKLDA